MAVVSSILKLEKTGARVWTGIFLLGPVLGQPDAPSFSLCPHGAFPNFSPRLGRRRRHRRQSAKRASEVVFVMSAFLHEKVCA